MRICRIEIKNFKSLVDFDITLPKLTCLIGLNGAGKSTVLQLIDFLSQLVRGDMKGWFSERRWKPTDVKSKLTRRVHIEFRITFTNEQGEPSGVWWGIYSPSKYCCLKERIEIGESRLEVAGDEATISSGSSPSTGSQSYQRFPINFSYEGSILSAWKEELLPPAIRECKHFIRGIRSLDLLAPDQLRQRTRESSGTLGLGGQNLASFIHEMSPEARREFQDLLHQAYPRLQHVGVKSLRSGWKQLEVTEHYPESLDPFSFEMTNEARHINDGMLRLMAILAELQSNHEFLLFDEVENGINPELVEFVLNQLTTARQQVVVTTHSPMILNYLDDQTARDGVVYLYRTASGSTRAIPFFSIPSLAEKLTVMGPGEAFVDTNLTELSEEISRMTEGA